MWFIWLGLGLTILTIAGLYTRRRLVGAAGALGLSPRGQRWLRRVVLWLLFGYPLLVFSMVAVTLALGGDRMAMFDGPLGTWLLVYPFFWTVLVVIQALPYLLVLELVQRVRRRRGSATWMGRGHAVAVLVPLVAFGIYTPARIVWQHGELRWRHHVVEAPRRDESIARPPARPLRIAFVADLQQDHHTDEPLATGVMRRLQASQPDLVLSGGDWINMGPGHIDGAARTAALLTSPLGTWTVRGDHEHFAFTDQDRSVQAVTEAMRARGVHMLHNEVRRFQHDGRTIAVAFLTYSYPARTAWTEIARLIAELDGADLKILVTHQLSDTTMALARDRVDLVLAAHTHGGQVNPVVGLWHVPLARLETRYIDGRYQVGGTTVIVTAGIGYSLVPFRYASPGSVETLEVRW